MDLREYSLFLGYTLALSLLFLGLHSLNDKDGDVVYTDETVQSATITSFDSQTNNDGEVSVTVTPLDQANLSFKVTLSTHSVDLGEDLIQVSTLVDENGKEYKPIKWEGDPLGGHHRESVLSFGEIAPRPQIITLSIGKISGIAERKFEWR
jgi:hypothetical protein